MDRAGHYWLHGLDYLTFDVERLEQIDEATQLIRQAIDFAKSLHQTKLSIETNGIGRFLPALVRRELRGSEYPLALIERHSTRAKTDRILSALDPILAAGHLHVHRSVMNSGLIEEMREWSPNRSTFDDGLDAVSNAILEQPVRAGLVSRALSSPGQLRDGNYVASSDFDI